MSRVQSCPQETVCLVGELRQGNTREEMAARTGRLALVAEREAEPA